MRQSISLKKVFLPKCNDKTLPYEVMFTAIAKESNLIEGEDYLIVGSDCYLRLNAALYLIARFGITNVWDYTETFEHLAKQEKKRMSTNDDRLPVLTPTEQDWNDAILPIIKSNAAILGLEFNTFLSKVYQTMDINFAKETGDYLEKIKLPTVTKISKFRVVTCNKTLRLKFEDAMAQVMENIRFVNL